MYFRIEFMGLPGSGKTTCLPYLLQSFKNKGFVVLLKDYALKNAIRKRNDGIIRNFAKFFPSYIWDPLCGIQNSFKEMHSFSCNYSKLMAHFFNLVCDSSISEEFRECITYDFFKTAAEHQLLTDNFLGERVVLAEEGFGQVGCLLLGYLPSGAVSLPAVQKYVESLPDLQMVVWVDAEPHICLSRLQQRPEMTIGLRSKSKARSLALLEQSRTCFGHIVDSMARCGVHVHHLRNNSMENEELLTYFSDIVSNFSINNQCTTVP